jgi:hypothetical protein
MQPKRWIVAAAGIAVALLVAFAVFRPDKLFVDQQVDEDLDVEVAAALDAATTTAPPVPAPSDPAPDTGAPETPAVEPADAPVVTASGAFVSQNGYSVRGSVAVVTQPDGTRTLVLQDLESDNGPDLQLYVSPSADGLVDGGTRLAPLKGNVGTQTYELPAELDLSSASNVVIWCERFSRAFGTATLA